MTAKVAKILSYMCARLVPPFYLRKIVCFRFVYKPKTWNRLLVVSTEESLICHTEKGGGFFLRSMRPFFACLGKALACGEQSEVKPPPPMPFLFLFGGGERGQFLVQIAARLRPPVLSTQREACNYFIFQPEKEKNAGNRS